MSLPLLPPSPSSSADAPLIDGDHEQQTNKSDEGQQEEQKVNHDGRGKEMRIFGVPVSLLVFLVFLSFILMDLFSPAALTASPATGNTATTMPIAQSASPYNPSPRFSTLSPTKKPNGKSSKSPKNGKATKNKDDNKKNNNNINNNNNNNKNANIIDKKSSPSSSTLSSSIAATARPSSTARAQPAYANAPAPLPANKSPPPTSSASSLPSDSSLYFSPCRGPCRFFNRTVPGQPKQLEFLFESYFTSRSSIRCSQRAAKSESRFTFNCVELPVPYSELSSYKPAPGLLSKLADKERRAIDALRHSWVWLDGDSTMRQLYGELGRRLGVKTFHDKVSFRHLCIPQANDTAIPYMKGFPRRSVSFADRPIDASKCAMNERRCSNKDNKRDVRIVFDWHHFLEDEYNGKVIKYYRDHPRDQPTVYITAVSIHDCSHRPGRPARNEYRSDILGLNQSQIYDYHANNIRAQVAALKSAIKVPVIFLDSVIPTLPGVARCQLVLNKIARQEAEAAGFSVVSREALSLAAPEAFYGEKARIHLTQPVQAIYWYYIEKAIYTALADSTKSKGKQ